ncbi:hypothetical protein [Rhizobium sp. 11_C7_N12_5]|uniref:hypothetical protein n=1 Tax=Rhizobium sp. 11_C7_N12_5 TaxID=3240770 RepID=UPI003F223BA8
MLKDRVDQLEEIVYELEGRCLMHEVFIGQLLGRAGMASGNMDLFVNGVLTLVGNDLETNAMKVTDKEGARRFASALESFAQFAEVMQNALKADRLN